MVVFIVISNALFLRDFTTVIPYRLHQLATFCTSLLSMARYNDGAFIQLFGSLSMVFFSKLFKSKQASTNKENNKTAQVKQNTVIERPDIASIPTDELRQVILSRSEEHTSELQSRPHL